METKEIEKRIVFEGKGIVWDPVKDKPLCAFDKNGKLITDNVNLINRLKELKFKYRKYNPDEEEKTVKPEDEIERLGHWIMTNYPAETGFPVDIAIRVMTNMKTLQDVESINKKDMTSMITNPYSGVPK